MRRAVKSLKRQAAKGLPVTRRRVAKTVATQIRKVLGNPHACAAAIKRNAKISRAYKRPSRGRMRSRSRISARRRRGALR
jgi:hypothetical protein